MRSVRAPRVTAVHGPYPMSDGPWYTHEVISRLQ